MRFNRRTLLKSAAMLGAAAAFPGLSRAQDVESMWDVMARNRVLRQADTTGNTARAMDAVETNEPILSYDTAYNLQNAIMQYEQIVAAGGWEPMVREANNLELGQSRRAVRVVKRRLMTSGDMPADNRPSDTFDEATDAGVRRFQARHGLLITGKVDEPTLYALAVPADYRLNQLRLNALRVQQFQSSLGSDRYVVVNIPAAGIEAVEGGTVARRHTAVVGRKERASPILNSKIHEINFNPYWNVPTSIIRADIIKYMNEDPEYLTKWRIHIYDGGREIMPWEIDWTTEEAVKYHFRQEPGSENSMGHVKINFHNRHSVYLHDTPQKALFGENARFHSSGCVRVENPQEMVAWILSQNGGWDINTVQAMFSTSERLDVSVSAPPAIHFVYVSAWANRQGTVSFRSDVYDYDKTGQVVFEV